MPANIDVTEHLERFEGLLEGNGNVEECQLALRALVRWQRDPDLTEASRERARALVQRFAPHASYGVGRTGSLIPEQEP